MSLALDDAVLPADPEFRAAVIGYVEWGTRLAMHNSQPDAPTWPSTHRCRAGAGASRRRTRADVGTRVTRSRGQPVPQTLRMRTLLTLASAVLVATLAAGCGGDSGDDNAADSTPSTSETPTDETPEAGGLTVTDGITPDDLVGCLTDAGLDAEATDSVPFGVEVPVVEVDVTGMTDYEGGTARAPSCSSSPTRPQRPTTRTCSRWAAATTRPTTGTACT